MDRNLKDWRSGDQILADDLQAFKDRHGLLYPMTVHGDGSIHQSPQSGTAISIRQRPPTIETFWAILGTEGTPGGSPGSPNNSGHWSWNEAHMVAGAQAILPGGRSGTIEEDYAFEVNGRAAASGDAVLLRRETVDDQPKWGFAVSVGVFRVKLVTDGGTVGSNAPPTAPTLTYTVKSRDGVTTLATTKSPLVRRFNFKVTAATWGYADFEAGNLVLIEALEVPDAGAC